MSAENDAESVLAQQVAGRLMGGIGVMDGTLMLTDRRLIFVPLISKAGLKLSSKAAKVSQKLRDWDFSPQRLLNTAIMPLATPIDMPLNRIRTIMPTRRCALLVSWVDTGKPRRAGFAVSASRFSRSGTGRTSPAATAFWRRSWPRFRTARTTDRRMRRVDDHASPGRLLSGCVS